nr:hypothetical protein CFP56_20250 [Quercus suber]
MLAAQERVNLYATAPQPVIFRRTRTSIRTMNELQAHDEETQASASSVVSDLSALENETDDFGRRILQHQRDTQRFNASRVPLSKRVSGTKHAERYRHEAPKTGADIRARPVRMGSAGSKEFDPPLNIPRDWGRKGGKRTMDWERKLNPHEVLTTVPANRHHQESGSILFRKTAYTGDESPFVNGRTRNGPVASIESTPPSKRSSTEDLVSSSMNHMNTTLNEALDAEDQEFSAVSLLASTPAINRRNRKIDELTRREIETVERRGITKRTLEHLTLTTAEDPRPATAPTTTGSDRQGGRPSRISVHNKENVHPKGERSALISNETLSLLDRKAPGLTPKKGFKPSHSRSDSYNLLKQLARVTSMSPSPGKSKIEPAVTGDCRDEKNDDSPVSINWPTTSHHGNDDSVLVVEDRDNQTERSQQYMSLGELDSTNNDVAVDIAPNLDMTPPLKGDVFDTKTPIVAGAWPTTPVPSVNGRTAQSIPCQPESEGHLNYSEVVEHDLKRTRSEPVLPKSALTDILAEARRSADMQIGESTFASLQEIANSNFDTTDPAVTLTPGDDVPNNSDGLKIDRLSSQAEKDRRQEALAIESMNKSLRNARTSIRDASRGLRRVENKIETAQNPISGQPIVDALSSTHFKASQVISQRGKPRCSHCGGMYKSIWRGLLHEFTDCFYTFSEPERPGFQLTKVGLFCILALIWYAMEKIACYNYCHSAYAADMIGVGVDPGAPEYPFVIPTVLLRPLKFLWKPLGDYLMWIGGIIFEWAIGDVSSTPYNPATFAVSVREIDKSRGRWREATQSLSATRTVQWMTATAALGDRALRSAADAVDEVGRIWDDEYIS